MWKQVLPVIFVIASMVVLEGCWAVVGGAAAEAGYVAAQSDRTPGETIDDQRIVASVKT
jgi:osmotically-inducible protein OsmY